MGTPGEANDSQSPAPDPSKVMEVAVRDDVRPAGTTVVTSESGVSPMHGPNLPVPSMSLEMWQGPLPHPRQLEAFGSISPDFPERIMAMAERQAAHRQTVEKMEQQIVLDADQQRHKTIRMGQVLGFTLCLTSILGGMVVIVSGHLITGGIISMSPIPLIVTAFVGGRFSNREPKPAGEKK